MLHIPPERVAAGNEKRMSAVAKLEELIASVRSNVDTLLTARNQAATLLETMGTRLEAAKNLLEALENARAHVERHGDVAMGTITPELDRLRALFADAPPSKKSPVNKPNPLPSPAEVVTAAKEVLLEVKRPMKRGQLVTALENRGAVLAGSDKNKNLGTILWRHPKDFVSLEGLGYWVKGVPLEGIYDPGEDNI